MSAELFFALAGYLSGFCLSAVIYGYHTDPSPDELWDGIRFALCWPVVCAFVGFAAIGNVLAGRP